MKNDPEIQKLSNALVEAFPDRTIYMNHDEMPSPLIVINDWPNGHLAFKVLIDSNMNCMALVGIDWLPLNKKTASILWKRCFVGFTDLPKDF